MPQKDDEKPVRLGVDLNEEASAKFRRIQKYLGIESNADVVRWLITWYYNEIESRSK